MYWKIVIATAVVVNIGSYAVGRDYAKELSDKGATIACIVIKKANDKRSSSMKALMDLLPSKDEIDPDRNCRLQIEYFNQLGLSICAAVNSVCTEPVPAKE